MGPPAKRHKHSPTAEDEGDNFISLTTTNDNEESQASKYGYTNEPAPSTAPREPRAMRNDPRNARDRPKSKHPLPGCEPWILVKTKFKRRFAHNPETGESFWRFPADIVVGVREFDAREREAEEKRKNAVWAEEQLKEMRPSGEDSKTRERSGADGSRRRRSESLQREDEAALLAEMAAEAEAAEERDVKEVVKKVEPLKPLGLSGTAVEESDSEYEVIEVTDSEFEDEEENGEVAAPTSQHHQPQGQAADDGPLEFGEDDMAYQLALMNEEQGSPSSFNGEEENEDYPSDEQEEDTSDSAAIFREMLTSHQISPYTPWETLISSSSSIITDPRYTALPSTRARKAVWSDWARDTAAQLQAERAAQKPKDPKIEFLAFLQGNANPKLYWQEFKRKFKKEGAMVAAEKKLGEREREKLYREFIAKLKLPERTREADLVGLLKGVPPEVMDGRTTLDDLPDQVRGHVNFYSLPEGVRDRVVSDYIRTLPTGSEGGMAGGRQVKEDAKRDERQRQEIALEERRRKVEEERKKAEQAERWAKKDLKEEENELRRAMEVGRKGLEGQLKNG